MKFREIFLGKKKRILLGKDKHSNDELMRKFKGKTNIILHTESPGSPFGVIDFSRPTKKEISLSGAAVAGYSQDWRDNKGNVKVNVFTGKEISKKKGMKTGTWHVGKSKKMVVKKADIKNAACGNRTRIPTLGRLYHTTRPKPLGLINKKI